MHQPEFVLEDDPGPDTVAGRLAAPPDAWGRPLPPHAAADSRWRVNHVACPAEALADIDPAFCEPPDTSHR